MKVLNYFWDNPLLVVAICGVWVGLMVIFKVQGFLTLLAKAAGIVIQQLCSLFLEMLFLFFKIINSLEIYIVLLIDALTGKVNSTEKMATMALGALSLASFYTTYTGMKYFIDADSYFVAFLITLGIQAILFSTSLRLSDTIDLNKSNNTVFYFGKWILGMGIGIIAGCIISYLIPLFPFPYNIEHKIYHIMYLIVICSVLACIFFLLKELVQNSSKNRNAGIFLMLIYCIVLSVSSFFSYQSFVSVMYPEDMRNKDAFCQYGTDVIALLETVHKDLDVDYYEAVLKELKIELEQIREKSKDAFSILSEEEKVLYGKSNEFEKYIEYQEQLADLKEDLKKNNEDCIKEQEKWVENNDGVGPNTVELYKQIKGKYDLKEVEINKKIEEVQGKLEECSTDISNNVEKYEKVKKKVEMADCSDDIEIVYGLLGKDHLSQQEQEQLKNLLDDIEQVKIIQDANNSQLNNNLWKMATVYRDYQEFRYMFSDTLDNIMDIIAKSEEYEDSKQEIQICAQKLIEQLPDTNYIFVVAEDKRLRTKSIGVSNYYEKLAVIKHKASSDLSTIEKNLRTFLSNKIIGVTCSLMALIIDMMILFVGIILPPDIDFEKKDIKYSAQEKKRILSNLFNKPIRR